VQLLPSWVSRFLSCTIIVCSSPSSQMNILEMQIISVRSQVNRPVTFYDIRINTYDFLEPGDFSIPFPYHPPPFHYALSALACFLQMLQSHFQVRAIIHTTCFVGMFLQNSCMPSYLQCFLLGKDFFDHSRYKNHSELLSTPLFSLYQLP
jgi:hypothetical protein